MKDVSLLKFSNRSFKAVYHIGFGEIEIFTFNVKTFEDGSELIYSLQDIIDKILDLRINEAMNFNANRDNDQSLGFIVRIT